MILHGDSLERLREFPDNYFSACVCDPPYGLSFMGKRWDYDVPSVELWREVLRVLKPGAHALIACGTRTQHRMAVNIEDAGFEIRDVVSWLYGSGFPKSLDVSKAIDKAAGAERKTAYVPNFKNNTHGHGHGGGEWNAPSEPPKTDDARTWSGWGTALKPACEFWTLVRKPLSEKTVAANVLRWGCGALNVDASRIGTEIRHNAGAGAGNKVGGNSLNMSKVGMPEFDGTTAQGRWPSNCLFDEEAAELLDEQSGNLGKSASGSRRKVGAHEWQNNKSQKGDCGFGDTGGASRFFYVAKASKSERNRGLEHFAPTKSQGARPNSADASGKFPDHDHRERGGNNHPTVKPIKLMEYLCKLICPPEGIILDPFAGSGSTGVAAKRLGFGFVGIERELEYVAIALKRMEAG